MKDKEKLSEILKERKIVVMLLLVLVGSIAVFGFGIKFQRVTCCGSMYPAIQNGDYVIVSTMISQNPVGQIVVYQYNSTLTPMHRVVFEVGGLYCMKGDNNPYIDGCFPYSAIRYQVVMVIHL